MRDILDIVDGRGMARIQSLPLPPKLRGLSQRGLLLSADFWRGLRAGRVLWFEPGTSVLCGRAAASLDDFSEWDWVGASRGAEANASSTRVEETNASSTRVEGRHHRLPGSGPSPVRRIPSAATARCP